ncbi:MAG: histidine phosphatase family protein [Bacteroidaceae bacterium]|nr:histidine phosphatase family protein [Bacteroidaceae bacterium]
MSTTLHLVRHGETIENSQGVFQGQTPGHLSEKGKEEAVSLRPRLAEMTFDIVLCSDLKRCLDTAEIALDGIECTFIKEPLLRERDLGNLAGTPIKGAVLNETVESEESMIKRANAFFDKVRKEYPDKRVLAFSHGFLCRIMQAELEGVTHRDVTLMGNCEIRTFVL